MSLVPNKRADKVAFFQSKVAPWTSNAAQIGTTTAAVTALDALITAAQDKLAAQFAAEQAAKTATQAANGAVAAMASAGSDIIKAIRAKAAVAGDSVYELAEIPSPSVPTPVGPPGTPTNFTATLDQTGALNLAWKCANPPGSSGTIYQVSRRIGADGPFVIIGAAGDKKFIDPTVPAGSALVVYRIQALRSTVAGPVGQFMVSFGVAPGGGTVTASVVPAAPKLAA